MNTTEFRLGNIIEFDGKISIIKEIDHQGVVVDIPETGENEWIDAFQFSPVSLSEEILLKSGFVKCVGQYGEYFKHDHYELLRVWKIVDGTWKAGKKDESNTCWIADFKSLHQFQNLYYSLVGEDLDFKLD